MYNEGTIIALSSPPGSGAISIIRLSGKDSISKTDKFFESKSGKKLKDSDGYSISYGNFLVNKEFFNNEIFVKVRSTGKLLRSKLNINNGSTKLILLEDEYGISPGQACVFYSKDELGDKVLGGGWITKN